MTNGDLHGRMPPTAPIKVHCSDSHEDSLRGIAQETLRVWSDVLAWCDSEGDPRGFEAHLIVAAAKQFLAGGGGNE